MVIARRHFLAGTTATLGVPLVARYGFAQPRRDLFKLGVASGDPAARSVVLWTRLAPEPLGDGGMPDEDVLVTWQVASDPRFASLVREGVSVATPAAAHSVHALADGLDPDRWYWYRFIVGGEESPAGRTRTLPRADAVASQFRFATVSCQHWENGYFSAYRGMRDDESLALVLHLGDYIYETSRGGVRNHETREAPKTLAQWRRRHALYKTDPDLQAAHAAVPFLCVPDNHNASWFNLETPEALAERAAAYQAWSEHLPLRAAAEPGSPSLPIYRSVDLGRLMRLIVLDTRQFRENHEICRDDTSYGFNIYQRACAAEQVPERSMLGRPQEQWLDERLASAGARWTCVASTVPFGHFDLVRDGQPYNYAHSWDGFPANRARIVRALQAHGVANPVVVSGDVHSSWVKDVLADPGEPRSRAIASEFVGTSISSTWPEPLDAPFRDNLGRNPQVRYYESRKRGYLLSTLTPARWTVDLMSVTTATEPGGSVARDKRFVVEAGRPGAVEA
jgi:alkaline phosphatase D